jgi:hypothetical protein
MMLDVLLILDTKMMADEGVVCRLNLAKELGSSKFAKFIYGTEYL